MDMSLGMSMGIVGTRSVMNERLTPGTSVCPGLSPGGPSRRCTHDDLSSPVGPRLQYDPATASNVDADRLPASAVFRLRLEFITPATTPVE